MLANSVIVAAIGILAYGVFHRRQRAASLVYLIARVFEATVLAVRRPMSATFCGHQRQRPVPGFPRTGL